VQHFASTAVAVAFLVVAWGCGDDSETTPSLGPEAKQVGSTSYTVVKFSASLGGTTSRGTAINNQGLVAGFSTLTDGTRHAAVWNQGVITDLRTLGGPGSTVAWPGINNQGIVVGISLTDRVDPLDEDWSCEAGGFIPTTTNLICRGFWWENGTMHELPTLGGTHGFATEVNSRGQIVGWAENQVHDPTCVGVQELQFRAVLWEPKKGTQQELPPLGDDSASAATAINDSGEVVGISGRCDQAVGRFSALHAVLWDHGTPTEIPNLGGTTWHTPMDINERGDVVGFSNPPGPGDPEGEFISHAFYWNKHSDTAVDIGVLEGDAFSEAFAINSRGQVVGVSFGGTNGARAFLWQNGQLRNLNDLVDIAPDVLQSAQDINDAGQITGRVRDAATGAILTFVATPKK
jgi:probable HAF family extracellular repeat protein